MRVCIIGCGGRMGRSNLAAAIDHPNCELVGGIDKPEHSCIGSDLGLLAGREDVGIKATPSALDALKQADVAIEFSIPEATLHHARMCAEVGVRHVIGTTGFSPEQDRELEAISEKIAIVRASNMSLGVNTLLALVRLVAQTLDDRFDIEIFERHHRLKVDAPSGTALSLGHAAAQGRCTDLETSGVFERHGLTGPRPSGAIGFAVSRAGDNVGEHEVSFSGQGERLVLKHVATDRSIYSTGSLNAATWLMRQEPGYYDMSDVLNLRE